MQVVLDTRGLNISVRNHCFLIEVEKETRIIHPQRISSILITMPCRISSPALILAAECQIPVVICNNCGKPLARIWSSRFLNTSTLRKKQYLYTTHEKSINWFEEIVKLKIQGQIDNLWYVSNRKVSIKSQVEKAEQDIHTQLSKFNVASNQDRVLHKKHLLFYEAYAAAQYWQLIGIKLSTPFMFENRIKRDPTDAFNACINYLYGMLRNQVEAAILSIGLDPALGVMHRDGYCLPSLVFDLMEPFRPIIDRVLLTATLQNQLKDDIMMIIENKHRINKAGRQQLIELFNNKLHSRVLFRGTTTSLQNQILNEVKLLADKIKQV